MNLSYGTNEVLKFKDLLCHSLEFNTCRRVAVCSLTSIFCSNNDKKMLRTLLCCFGLKEKIKGMAGSQRYFLQTSSNASEASDQTHCCQFPAFLVQHGGGRWGPLPYLCCGQIPKWLHQVTRGGMFCLFLSCLVCVFLSSPPVWYLTW